MGIARREKSKVKVLSAECAITEGHPVSCLSLLLPSSPCRLAHAAMTVLSYPSWTEVATATTPARSLPRGPLHPPLAILV